MVYGQGVSHDHHGPAELLGAANKARFDPFYSGPFRLVIWRGRTEPAMNRSRAPIMPCQPTDHCPVYLGVGAGTEP